MEAPQAETTRLARSRRLMFNIFWIIITPVLFWLFFIRRQQAEDC
jgi:hypothetical protein